MTDGVKRMHAAHGPLAQTAWPVAGVATEVPGWVHVGWMRHHPDGTPLPVYLPAPTTGKRCDPTIYTHNLLCGLDPIQGW